MREIEIKARLTDRQAIIDQLLSQGVTVSETVAQHDKVFGRAGVAGGPDNQEPWLRIRTETKDSSTIHYFTLKRSVTNQLDSIEYETKVADDTELENIIMQLDFVPYSDLVKTRQKAKIGEIEICIDHVEKLGDFIEAEKMTDDEVLYQPVIDELWAVLESVGVRRADEVTDGYDVLMNKYLGQE